MINRFFILCLIIATGSGCKKPYNPAVISAPNNYLVVEGLINAGADSTFIKLSRTVNISSTATTKPEPNAAVYIESEQGRSYLLHEAGTGLYVTAPLNLSFAAKYRIRIKTSNDKEYLSDYVEAKATPEIDSLTYGEENDGLQFYVNSHDPKNNTHYYRWDFDETWKYQALNQSNYKLGANGLPTFRVPFVDSIDNIYSCYKSNPSHQVLLGSSAKLGKDVIFKQPVDFVAPESGKLSHGYSVLIRQYALTADGFNYWQLLKKNTEQLGSIFDAQPSMLQGNIHCTTNAAEPVIGYISASSITKKRIYVDPTDIKATFVFPYYIPPPEPADCESKFIPIAPVESFKERIRATVGSGDSVILNAVQPIGAPAIIGYAYIQKECGDCRAKPPFGTNLKPAFFPSY